MESNLKLKKDFSTAFGMYLRQRIFYFIFSLSCKFMFLVAPLLYLPEKLEIFDQAIDWFQFHECLFQ